MTLHGLQLTVECATELEYKINSITNSLSKSYYRNSLIKLSKKNFENASIINDYIITEQNELNIKNSTKEGKIKILVWLSNHFQDEKSFKEMTKYDILAFLNKLRKSSVEDPTHKWIGSYNGRQMVLNKFFRRLYNPNEPDNNKRETPEYMKGVRKLPRKEKTSYNSEDIWGPRENAIFLKYCPSIRDRCYHAMSVDTSARPHELLNLKIKDVKFHVTEEGKQYAEVRIIEGKTGTRKVPLIDSLPYLKEYLSSSKSGDDKEYSTNSTNPDSWIFVSTGNNHGSKLTYDGLATRYVYYKKKYFPSLLKDETIPEVDKSWIRNMLTKPWNLYILRHSSLTEKSQIVSESVLRDHAGWSMSSKMPQVYIHLSNESSKILLEKRGIINKKDKEISTALKSRECPNCNEPNKPESKFCIKCNMVMSFDSYNETIKERQCKEKEMVELKQKYETDIKLLREEMENKFQYIINKIEFNKLH